MEVGGEGDYYNIYLSLHCHHQNDSCIKVFVYYQIHPDITIMVDWAKNTK